MLSHLPRKLLVLAQEPVSWVDSLNTIRHANVNDAVDVQVGPHRRLVGSDEEGLVCLVPVLSETVLVGVYGHSLDIKLSCCTAYPVGGGRR